MNLAGQNNAESELVVNALSAQHGGIVTYTLNLIRHMRKSGLTGKVYVPPPFLARVEEKTGDGVNVLDVNLSGLGGIKRLFWEQLNWRRIVRDSGARVLYSSANYGLVRPPIPQILMIQGEISFNPYYQEAVLPRLSRMERIGFALRRRLVRWSMRHSDIVLFPSLTSMESVVGDDPELAEKSRVNYLCAEDSLKNMQNARIWREDGVLKTLYISVYYPHKDPLTLVRAIGKLRESGMNAATRITMKDEDFTHWSSGPADLKKLRAPEHSDFLTLGHVPHKNIDDELKQHDVLVSTSLAETFGFPLVESMAAGIPVVATDVPIHREICGDAALYFAPGDSDDLAKQLVKLDDDADLRATLTQRGHARVGKMYGWSQHLEILRDCVSSLGVTAANTNQHSRDEAAKLP
ncbi:MAG: glycosyltransferase involved in cell wall biosynthesis [Paracoccaceae bacterium]